MNVTAPLALTQAFLPSLRRAAPARILLVGAGIADRAQPGTGIYGITKKALARLFEQMITDFEHEGRADLPAVALFQPGLVDTEGLRDHIAAATGLRPAARRLAGNRAGAEAGVRSGRGRGCDGGSVARHAQKRLSRPDAADDPVAEAVGRTATRFRPPPSERDFPDKACRY